MSNINVEDFLEHFGKKGMKWGVRNEAKSAARAQNRALNRESRQRDAAKNAKAIDKAREKVNSGKLNSDWDKAKQQYKVDKVNMGSREAHKILTKKKTKINEEYYKSQELKDGKEVAKALAVTGALSIGYGLLMAAARA